MTVTLPVEDCRGLLVSPLQPGLAWAVHASWGCCGCCSLSPLTLSITATTHCPTLAPSPARWDQEPPALPAPSTGWSPWSGSSSWRLAGAEESGGCTVMWTLTAPLQLTDNIHTMIPQSIPTPHQTDWVSQSGNCTSLSTELWNEIQKVKSLCQHLLCQSNQFHTSSADLNLACSFKILHLVSRSFV